MLTFYTYVPRNWNASFYYRIFVPFHTARDLGLPIRVHVDTNDAEVDPEHRVRAFCESDVVMLYQPVSEPTLANIRYAKSIIPSKRDGEWKYPPSFVVDTDDNLFNVNPYNIAYRGLGFRDHEGNDLPNGHMIGTVQDGKKVVLWKDGQDNFDIARNRQTIQTYRNMLEIADAVSCSTPRVAEAIKADCTPSRVKVFPNMVRFDHYEQPDLVHDTSKVKILWQGGASHYEDWFPLRESLGEITRKYPNVHWYIWGQLYPWVMNLIPPDRYTFINWCPYQEYKLRLAMIGHDINLAPLSDNRFNRCRSAIKMYEAAVLKRPAATLAQDTGPYHDELIDGQTALLFKTPQEFTEKLSLLIEDTMLRKNIAANAKDWVSENRDAFKLVPKTFAFFEELREIAKREQPHMPEVDWEPFAEQMMKEAEEAQKPEVAEVG